MFTGDDPFLNALMSCEGGKKIVKMNMKKWATASPRFIVPDNMLIDAIDRARRDVRKIKDREWNLWNTSRPRSLPSLPSLTPLLPRPDG